MVEKVKMPLLGTNTKDDEDDKPTLVELELLSRLIMELELDVLL